MLHARRPLWLFAGFLCVFSGRILAFPIVEQWHIRVESGFVVTQSTTDGPIPGLASGLTGSDPSVEPSFGGAPTTLSWGDPGNENHLSIAGDTGGHGEAVLTTDGPLENSVTATVNNRTITTATPRLVYGGLLDGFWADPIAPAFYEGGIPGTGEIHLPAFWHLYYWDTLDSGSCDLPGPTACSDLLIVVPEGIPYLETLGAFGESFDYFGHTYLALLQIEGLSDLDPTLCGMIGTSHCQGVLLPENTDATLQFKVGIHLASVPEPNTFALVAFLLLPLLLQTRRITTP